MNRDHQESLEVLRQIAALLAAISAKLDKLSEPSNKHKPRKS